MNHLSKIINENCPEYNQQNAIFAFSASFVFYFIIFVVLFHILQFLIKDKFYLDMSLSQKILYTSYYHATIHAAISMLGSLYCFVYADGQPGTSWFHDDSYRFKMFDIQKFLNISSLGYFSFDFGLLCYTFEKFDAQTSQNFVHHVTGAGGIIFGNSIGGILGSIS